MAGSELLKIGYLINQYPAPCHTFIRREIAGLRELGTNVSIFSVRRYRGTLISDVDRREASETSVILDARLGSILWAVIRTLLSSPRAFFSALHITFAQLARNADRGRLRHLAYFAEACVLRRWLQQREIAHVHVHHGTNSTAVAMICRALGGPTFSFTPHGPEEFERGDAIALRQKIAAAAFVVGISEFAIQELRRFCDPAHWPKLHLVRCGVDETFLNVAPLTPVPDVNRIACIGRLCPAKMQHVLIEAAAQLIARGISVHVTLVGDGETRPDLERLVDERHLHDHVHLTGWATEADVRDAILASRVTVLPSRAEGLPVAIMESLALGRPVITTPVAAIPELIKHGESGWLVPPDNVEQLATAIEQSLKTSATELSRMAAIGRRRVAELHDAVKNAAELKRHIYASTEV